MDCDGRRRRLGVRRCDWEETKMGGGGKEKRKPKELHLIKRFNNIPSVLIPINRNKVVACHLFLFSRMPHLAAHEILFIAFHD